MSDQTPERHEPREGRVVSEICRECGVLTGGTVAGNAVRWTLCDDCERRSGEERRNHGQQMWDPEFMRGADRRAPSTGETPREFRKKPVVVRAVQYTEADAKAIVDEVSDDFHGFRPQEVTSEEGVRYRTGRLKVQTLESDPNHPHVAEPGDWIIWGVKGEPYPCKPDIFEATYEAAAPPAVEDGGEDADTLLHIADDIFRYSDSRDAGWASASIVALREIAARLRGSTEDAPEASDGVTAQELRAALRWTWKTLDGRFGRDHACPECCPEGGDLVDENFRCVRHSINRLLNGRLATEDAPERFTLAEMGDLLEAEADHIQIVGGSAKWMRDAANWFWHEAEKEIPGIVSRAATEDEGRTVYYARCGWCGAYEGTVDPREACAQDPATGEFIGPHQFAVYEAALTPEPTEEEG